MEHHPTTRRAFLKALPVAALALPVALNAGAIELPTTDPALVAIAKARKLSRRFNAAYDGLDAAEARVRDTLGRRPFAGLVSWRHHTLGASELEGLRDRLVFGQILSPEAAQAELEDAQKRLRAKTRQALAWDRRAGIGNGRKVVDRLRKELWRSEAAMARVVPTTLAGAAALAELVARDMPDADEQWHAVAVRSIAKALRSLARV